MPPWDAASYVMASRYRQETLEQLGKRPGMPSHIASDTSLNVSHVSRALNELREKGIVELKVDENVRKGRIYGITDKGENVLDAMVGLT